MNALSRVVSDLTQRKSSRKHKYLASTDDDSVDTAMAFASPLHEADMNIKKPTGDCVNKVSHHNNNNVSDTAGKKLERGSIDLCDVGFDKKFLKQHEPALKRVSAAIKEKFNPDFLRSKSVQRLSDKDDRCVQFQGLFDDCKQSSSMEKIKKQARVIDVRVQQLSTRKSNGDGRNLLKHDEMDSD